MSKDPTLPDIIELERLAEKWNEVAQHIVRQNPRRVAIARAAMTPEVESRLNDINRRMRPLIAQARELESQLPDEESVDAAPEQADAWLLAHEAISESVREIDLQIAPIALEGQELMASVFAKALGDDTGKIAPDYVHTCERSEGFKSYGAQTLARAFAPKI